VVRVAAILIAVAGCAGEPVAELADGQYAVEWYGLVPEEAPWRACDTFALADGGLFLSWGGDGCFEPTLTGVEHEGCAYFAGERYIWWLCPSDEPGVIEGERHKAWIADRFLADLVQ
jgi:hypothetical protein